MRIWHRYLGFFLAGIMAIYALSGIVMIFRNTDFLKIEKRVKKKLTAGLSAEELGKAVRIRDLKIESENGDLRLFSQGSYNYTTGDASYITKSLPAGLEKLTRLHKANTQSPLLYLNIFFGVSLLFFVVSSFWMFLPGSNLFKKGLYFTLAGIALTVILLLI